MPAASWYGLTAQTQHGIETVPFYRSNARAGPKAGAAVRGGPVHGRAHRLLCQAASHKLQAASCKRQATSGKLQAAGPLVQTKPQAASDKLQAPSHKQQAPGQRPPHKVSGIVARGS